MTGRFRVVVLDDYLGVAESMADWSSSPYDLDVLFVREHIPGGEALRDVLTGASVIVAMRERTRLDAALLRTLPDLRLIVTAGLRNDSIDPVEGVTVCGTPMLPAPAAELTWGLILSLSRRIVEEDRALRSGRWHTGLGSTLDGQTLGVVGLGRLGERVARLGRAFGMRVLAWSPNLAAERAVAVGVEAVSADELFTASDVVSIHMRLSERTRHLVDAARLRQMKPSALLINTSRAGLVDTDALIGALEREEIGGAGLDVFDVEPLPAGHRLRQAPRTVLTPHLGYAVRQSFALIYTEALDQIERFLSGDPVRVLGPESLASADEQQ